MSALLSTRSQDRGDRYVRRTLLRLDPHASRERLAARLEEALRLAFLPGEDQGRVYYFRRLHVDGLPPDGDRNTWLARFQSLLSEAAASAVHGSRPDAITAPAVYFASEHQALEILLTRVLTRGIAEEWFWPMVIGPAAQTPGRATESPRLATIPMVVERLRQSPASWVTVAAAVFAALEQASDPVR